MPDLSGLELSGLIELGSRLRRVGDHAQCLEEAARSAVDLIFQELAARETGERCALARFYTTCTADELARLHRRPANSCDLPGKSALVLLASRGVDPKGNDPRDSFCPESLPLDCRERLDRVPLVAELMRQLGLDAEAGARPETHDSGSICLVHVEQALGSPLIQDQDEIVERHGVCSALGLGGVLPGGRFFSLVLLLRAPLTPQEALPFRSLGLNLELGVLPFADGPTFACPTRPSSRAALGAERRLAIVEQLLETNEQVSLEEVRFLEGRAADLARFKDLSDYANDAMFFVDRDANILYANTTACGWLGYSQAELTSMTVPQIDPDYSLVRFQAVFDAAQGHADVEPFETRHRRRDGSELPVEIVVTGIPHREDSYVLAVARDISERRKAESAREAAERLYRSLTDGSLDAIIVSDCTDRILVFNPAAQRMFGYTESDAIGQPVTMLMPEEFRQRHQEGMKRYSQTRIAHMVGRTVELIGRHKNATQFPIEIALSGIEQPNGLLLLASIRDLTDRQRMQARVHQSEKLASLGLLSAGVAHEINNPLAYVTSNLSVIEEYARGLMRLVNANESLRPLLEDRPEALHSLAELEDSVDLSYIRENLEPILASTRQGVRRMAEIVRQLKGFARPDRHEPEWVELREIVESSLEMIRQQLRSRGIETTIEHEPGARVRCAAAQINQVVLNLLVNAQHAIESAPASSRHIGIRTRLDPPMGVIEVEDTGVGIPPATLARIFEPFFTSKPVGQGTGLGLAICHGIITDHHGRIEVSSTPGQGTLFRVLLPIDGNGSPTP